MVIGVGEADFSWQLRIFACGPCTHGPQESSQLMYLSGRFRNKVVLRVGVVLFSLFFAMNYRQLLTRAPRKRWLILARFSAKPLLWTVNSDCVPARFFVYRAGVKWAIARRCAKVRQSCWYHSSWAKSMIYGWDGGMWVELV